MVSNLLTCTYGYINMIALYEFPMPTPKKKVSLTQQAQPKHAALADALEIEVRRLAPGTPIPAVTTLMERFQMSQGTVVHALRHLRSKGLVMRPPRRKRLVAVTRSPHHGAVLNILLLRSQWSSPDYDAMSYALLTEANQQRLHLEILHYGSGRQGEIATALQAHDAIIILPSSTDSGPLYSLVEDTRKPVVMLWEKAPIRGAMSVADDDLKLGSMATKHLLKLGHKKVVAFLSEPLTPSTQRRLAGWEQVMRAAGHKHPEQLLIDCSVEPGKDAIVGSYEKLRRWLYQNNERLPASSVFCLGWTGALGMLRALREVGLEVPRDVSILSHGGENRLCEFTNPALTVVQCNLADFASEALNLVKEVCLGRTPAKTDVLLPPFLIERESTRAITPRKPQHTHPS